MVANLKMANNNPRILMKKVTKSTMSAMDTALCKAIIKRLAVMKGNGLMISMMARAHNGTTIQSTTVASVTE